MWEPAVSGMEKAHNRADLSYRRIRRYLVWRLKRLEARDFSRVRIKFLIHNGKEALHRYLVEVIIKIADYIFSDSEKTKKGVDRAMGGEVLELKTDKLINEIRQDVKEEVKAEVKEEVKTETKEKIVICMLKRGKSTLEEIAADTQMPIEQVERIKKEQQL